MTAEAKLESGKVILTLDGTKTISDNVCKLCVVLAASSCAELPCAVFVRPYFPQLRWTAAGNLTWDEPDTSGLPEWPTQVFKRVHHAEVDKALFAPHLLGIDAHANNPVFGFNVDEDFLLLLKQELLEVRLVYSYLMVSIKQSLKVNIQNLFRTFDWWTATAEIWLLCIRSIPDPYAEPLWLSLHETLRMVISHDVLPILTSTHADIPDIIETLSTNSHYATDLVARRLMAFCCASLADLSILRGFLDFITPGSAVRQSFTQLTSFLTDLMDLITLIRLAPLELYEADVVVSQKVQTATGRLLGKYQSCGCIAILELYRMSDLLGGSDVNYIMQQACISLRSTKFHAPSLRSDIENLLSAALARIHDTGTSAMDDLIHSLDNSLGEEVPNGDRIMAVTSTLLNACFICRQKNAFEVAIQGLESVLTFWTQHTSYSPALILHLVVTCELLQCFNAIGVEESATRLLRCTIPIVVRDRFVQQIASTTPAIVHPIRHLWSFAEQQTKTVLPPSEQRMCDICQTQRDYFIRYISHEGLECLECWLTRHEGDTSVQQQDESQHKAVATSSTVSTGKRIMIDTDGSRNSFQMANAIARASLMNLDQLVNLSMIVADSYIGTARYDPARLLLERVLDSPFASQDQRSSLLGLRLSKILRRQDRALSVRHAHTDVIRMISGRLATANPSIQHYCLDEFESVVLEGAVSLLNGDTGSLQQGYNYLKEIYIHSQSDAYYERLSAVNYRLRSYSTDNGILDQQNQSGPSSPVSASSVNSQPQLEAVLLNLLPNLDDDQLGTYMTDPKTLLRTAEVPEEDVVQRSPQHESDMKATNSDGQTALHVAADHNDVRKARLLLYEGADVDAQVTYGIAPLHRAAYYGAKDVMECLLLWGADVAVRDKGGLTALHYAVMTNKDRRDIVRLLLEQGADIEAQTWSGRTPLVAAFLANQQEMMRLLLELGADVNIQDDRGNSLLHLAVQNDQQEMVRLLLELGANIEAKDMEGNTPFVAAFLADQQELARLLLKLGADIEAKDAFRSRTLLHTAVRRNQQEMVRLLLKLGANIEAKDIGGNTPLVVTVLAGQQEMTWLLLELGADIEAKDGYRSRTPLHTAVFDNQQETVRLLLELGANTEAKDIEDKTPLQTAFLHDEQEMVRFLLELGADTEAKDNFGQTILQIAVLNNQQETTRFLLEQGANIETRDGFGHTPLYNAVSQDQRPMVRLLLEQGANIEAKDIRGHTPLQIALLHDEEWMIRLLLKHGADMNATDNVGSTPLHNAIINRKEYMVRLLLEWRRNIEGQNDGGLTLLMMAIQDTSLRTETVKLLLDHGADVKAKDRNGHAALWHAKKRGDPDIVNLLRSPGAGISWLRGLRA